MLGEVILIANACGVAWNPVEVLPNEIRATVQGAQVLDPCRVGAMPKVLREYLAEKQGGARIDMAERGAFWNSSCVMFAGDPNRQLVAAARAGQRWVVHYRTGGFMPAEHAMVVMVTRSGVRPIWAGSCQDRDWQLYPVEWGPIPAGERRCWSECCTAK